MLARFSLLVLAIASSGCMNGVKIRVSNNSTVPLSAVVVQFPSQTVTYGDIPAGAATEYRAVDEAYRYAYVEAMVAGQRAVIQPIDFVGETLLPSGNYTYVLTYQPDAEIEFGRIRLALETD